MGGGGGLEEVSQFCMAPLVASKEGRLKNLIFYGTCPLSLDPPPSVHLEDKKIKQELQEPSKFCLLIRLKGTFLMNSPVDDVFEVFVVVALK